MADHRSARVIATDYAPRPSAYAHYKSLLQTFDELDAQVDAEQRRLEDLEAELRRHEHAVQQVERRRHAQELAAWERERDRQLDVVCERRVALEQLRREREQLEAQELRLTAELEVVREQQQRALETDAKRIRDLVHAQPLVLDRELAKGQLDLELLQQIVQTARRRNQQQQQQQDEEGEQRDSGVALRAVVGAVQQRREDAFRAAAAQFQERLQSFEREKEALQQQSEQLQRRKQRALQILSSNQQEVVQGFFTTPRAALESPNPPMPSLSFDAIMATLQQSGSEVGRLQGTTFAQLSARRRLEEALVTAKTILATGPARVNELEQRMKQRERDVEALRVQSRETREQGIVGYGAPYDGRWRLETYPSEQLALASSIRALVWDWMETAITISEREPERAVLEAELQQGETARLAREQHDAQERTRRVAAQLCEELLRDVTREMAESIRRELQHSASRVQEMFCSMLRQHVIQQRPTMEEKPSERRRTTNAEEETTAAQTLELRQSLLLSAWDEMKKQRCRRLHPWRYETSQQQTVSTTNDTTSQGLEVSASSDPQGKRRRGWFSTADSTNVTTKSPNRAPHPKESTVASSAAVALGTTPSSSSSTRVVPTHVTTQETILSPSASSQDQERVFWMQHVMHDALLSFSSLASCGLVSCTTFSPDARLLACGTLDGEMVVFDLATGTTSSSSSSPVAVRVWVPATGAAAKKTPALGARARVQRVAFSSDSRSLLVSNQLKTVTLWSLHPEIPSSSSHSSDCFNADVAKLKPSSLEFIEELSAAHVFRELPCPSTVLTHDAPSFVAKMQSRPPIAITSTDFVPTLSLSPSDRPSVLCGASNGDVMRVWPQPRQLANGTSVFCGGSAAAFDVPAPGDTALSSSERAVTRELFRSHQAAVLFVGLLRCSAAPVETPCVRLVTVDQDGCVAKWECERTQFSGFGWFVPVDTCRLDFSASATDASKGEMLQIALSPARTRLIVMVYFPSKAPPAPSSSSSSSKPSGRLRFVQLNVDTETEMTVVPVHVERELKGTIAPRFAVISASRRQVYGRVAASVTPRESTLSHVLVLLMDNALSFVSLETGDDVRAVLPLLESLKPRDRSAASLVFNAVTAVNTSERLNAAVPSGTVACIAVSGEQHRQIRVLRLRIKSSN
ncbi:hypothetical protein PINS_up009105 [Pythium insidiosum]|nr:hypothetical protein PINS_up009105 [Pythium insidiosum]